MNLGEVFTIIQSMMTFFVVSDMFYERILRNKLLPKLNAALGLPGLDRDELHKPRCNGCFLHGSWILNKPEKVSAMNCSTKLLSAYGLCNEARARLPPQTIKEVER